MYSFAMAIYISYKHGTRYAFQREFSSGYDEVLQFVKDINRLYGDVGMGVYTGTAFSNSCEDIIATDSYYQGIEFVESVDEFMKLVKESEEVEPLDLAILVANRIKCTPLKLQKMLYLVYCNYLKKYDRPLFAEEFRAWDLGPVVPSVYEKFKGRRDDVVLKPPKTGELRYLSSDKGRAVLSSVDETIEKYGHLSASDLVDLTHESGRAWGKVFKKSSSNAITIDCIKSSKDID